MKIGCKYTRAVRILPSMCDRMERLRIVDALDLFEDTATLHAENFEIGPSGMDKRNYFWVITKIRIHVNRLPDMMDSVELNTWIQKSERVRCERDFSFVIGDEQLIYGRSIWAIISRDTKKLVHMDEVYPKLDFNILPPDDRPFAKIDKNFDDAEGIGEYKVRSSDIDLGGHLNNVNYVRAMLGCFTCDELEELNISELELSFISQTYEGETLRFKCRRVGEKGADGRVALEIGAVNEEGKLVFMSLIS